MELFRATVEVPPVTKKNHQQIFINKKTKKPFVTQSESYKEYERKCKQFLFPAKQPISEPVNVQMVFYMKTHRRVDLSNLQSAMLDVLVKYGVIKDDNCGVVASHDGSRVDYDKDRPRTEIIITTKEK